MAPTTVYPTILTVSSEHLPDFLHQCMVCCVLLDGPFNGLIPTTVDGRRTLVSGDRIVFTYCPACKREKDQRHQTVEG